MNTFTLSCIWALCLSVTTTVYAQAENPQEDSSARLIEVYVCLSFNRNSGAPPTGLPQVPIRVERVQKRARFALFMPSALPLRDRNVPRWIWHTWTPAGSVVVNLGARSALATGESNRCVLANGVLSVGVAFVSGHAVRILVRKKTTHEVRGYRSDTPGLHRLSLGHRLLLEWLATVVDVP